MNREAHNGKIGVASTLTEALQDRIRQNIYFGPAGPAIKAQIGIVEQSL